MTDVATAVLTRAPFQPLAVQESWDRELLERAKTLLGYNPAAAQKAEEVRRQGLDGAIFARVLEDLGIEPFTLASVEAYKASRVREAHKGESWALTRYMHRSGRTKTEAGERVVRYTGVPVWLGSIITSIVCAALHFGGTDTWGWDVVARKSLRITHYMPWQTVGQVMLWPALALGAWSLLMYLRHKKAIQIKADWRNSLVQHYQPAIPAFVVERMLQLKQALPEVTFSVQQLEVSKQELKTEKYIPPPAPDPFLVATFRGISCYVDVWDEPKFEGRRTV